MSGIRNPIHGYSVSHIEIGAETVKINNASWYDWLTQSQQKTRFGRVLQAGKDFVMFMNGSTAVANVGVNGSYFNGSGTVGAVLQDDVNGNYLLAYVVIMRD